MFSLDSNRALAPPHDQPSPRSYLNFGLSGTLRRSAAFSDLGRLVLERQPSGFGQRPVNHRGPGKALTVSCRRRCRRSRRRHRRLRRLRPPSPHRRLSTAATFAELTPPPPQPPPSLLCPPDRRRCRQCRLCQLHARARAAASPRARVRALASSRALSAPHSTAQHSPSSMRELACELHFCKRELCAPCSKDR